MKIVLKTGIFYCFRGTLVHRFIFIIIIIIIIIIIRTCSTCPSEENKNYLLIVFATPEAPASRETENSTSQGSNQWLTAPLYHSNVPVSNKV